MTTTPHITGRPGRISTRHVLARRPAVPVDIYQCDDHYVELCDLPGLDPGSLDVQIQGTTITLHAYRSTRPTPRHRHLHRRRTHPLHPRHVHDHRSPAHVLHAIN